MKTLSLRRREQILAAYDEGKVTRQEVADRFSVSLGMVKKLLQQRRATGDIGNRQRFTGRKPIIREEHRRRMTVLLDEDPKMKLSELRKRLRISCTLPAIHRVLADMGLTYAKRCPDPSDRVGRK